MSSSLCLLEVSTPVCWDSFTILIFHQRVRFTRSQVRISLMDRQLKFKKISHCKVDWQAGLSNTLSKTIPFWKTWLWKRTVYQRTNSYLRKYSNKLKSVLTQKLGWLKFRFRMSLTVSAVTLYSSVWVKTRSRSAQSQKSIEILPRLHRWLTWLLRWQKGCRRILWVKTIR